MKSNSHASVPTRTSKRHPRKKGRSAAIDLSNLAACIEDARRAALDNDPGPSVPLDFHKLRAHLETAKASLSPLYRQAAAEPFLQTLDQIGAHGFQKILEQDPERERLAGLMLDIAAAILQPAAASGRKPVAAFHELVSDLYDGFLSAEDRRSVAPPDLEVSPPLVKFGNPDAGPYTWPVDATRSFGLKVGVVSLPPSNARRGILAWTAIGHETAGHDILHADNGLLDEVSHAVRRALRAKSSTAPLASYWADRIDETASDVLGILNMGPSAAIGIVGYFRGLNAAFGGPPILRNAGPASDAHPADIVRGFLAAEVVRGLAFSGASAWADVVLRETEKDAKSITLEGRKVPTALARASAEAVARAIANTPMKALEDHAFGEIQTWRDRDETVTSALREMLAKSEPVPLDVMTGVYAAHVVAAAATGALAKGGDPVLLFERMVDLLQKMNESNPSFGPLPVRHPGDIVRDRTWLPVAREGELATAARRAAGRSVNVGEPTTQEA